MNGEKKPFEPLPLDVIKVYMDNNKKVRYGIFKQKFITLNNSGNLVENVMVKESFKDYSLDEINYFLDEDRVLFDND